METISILGCGWLGMPLAETLIAQGFAVNGSTTSAQKIAALESKKITPFLISLEPDAVEGDINSFLSGSQILVIDIPPRFHFSQKIAALVPHIVQSGIRKVLFINSTAIYPDENQIVTESQIPIPKTDKSQQLFDAENHLRHSTDFETTTVRFGGLIDENRHPVKYIAGEQHLGNPDAPINLIHKKDCIGILLRIIEKDIWGETFNAAAPYHPTRAQYYTQKAIGLKLLPPQFDHSKPSVGKIIDSTKLRQLLDYEFQFGEL